MPQLAIQQFPEFVLEQHLAKAIGLLEQNPNVRFIGYTEGIYLLRYKRNLSKGITLSLDLVREGFDNLPDLSVGDILIIFHLDPEDASEKPVLLHVYKVIEE